MENILLASVTTLPKLIEGKVCVINEDGSYTLYGISKNCIIKDDFDPMLYCILNDEKYKKCIIYSKSKEKEEYLIFRQLKDIESINNHNNKHLAPIEYPKIKMGDKIHIKSRRGIYEVVDVIDNNIVITCKIWQYDNNKYRRVNKDDFQCFAGDRHR